MAAQRTGADVPIKRLPIAPDSPAALKILTGDNEIPRLAITDERALAALLGEVAELDTDGLLGTGYDELMLANLRHVARERDELDEFDPASHWVGLPTYVAVPRPPVIVLHFRDAADRDELLRRMGANVINAKQRRTWSVWWPEREHHDTSSLRFE